MVLASGIARVKELRAAGSPVGLGVDGSASNDHSNLIQEVRQALLIQRLRYEADEFTHKDALTLATKGSAQLLKRDDIGELAVGKKADLALFEEDRIKPQVPKVSNDLPGGCRRLVQKADGIAMTIVNGKVSMRKGKYTGADSGEVLKGPLAAQN
mgnify:CR=1 FL=1